MTFLLFQPGQNNKLACTDMHPQSMLNGITELCHFARSYLDLLQVFNCIAIQHIDLNS